MRLRRIPIVFLAAQAAVLAEDFWTIKDSAQWSEAQIRRIVTGSPWAKDANVSLKGNLPPEPRSVRSIQTPGEGSDAARAAADIAGNSNPTPPGIVVRWESATPVSEACARGGMDRELSSCVSKILHLSDLETKFVELSREFYILSMSNYPAAGNRAPQHSAAATAALEQISGRIQQAAVLKRVRKTPIRPSKVVTLPAGRTLLVVLFFPRTELITLADKEVLFESAGEIVEVKSRFDLRKMTYKGRLDL